jgi:hypothetical protein
LSFVRFVFTPIITNKNKIIIKKKIVFIIIATILFVVIIIYFCSENIDYSKNELRATRKIGNGLYLEIYKVYSGGVYGGDIRTFYLGQF